MKPPVRTPMNARAWGRSVGRSGGCNFFPALREHPWCGRPAGAGARQPEGHLHDLSGTPPWTRERPRVPDDIRRLYGLSSTYTDYRLTGEPGPSLLIDEPVLAMRWYFTHE